MGWIHQLTSQVKESSKNRQQILKPALWYSTPQTWLLSSTNASDITLKSEYVQDWTTKFQVVATAVADSAREGKG
jgi:hypothetical protein